jgi:hypothetical protein
MGAVSYHFYFVGRFPELVLFTGKASQGLGFKDYFDFYEVGE